MMVDEFIEVEGSEPTEIEKFWLEICKKSVANQEEHQDEVAKQLIAVASFLQGIYFTAVSSFSDLKRILDPGNWGLVLIFAAPILLWLASIAIALQVFVPYPKFSTIHLQSPDAPRKIYLAFVSFKHTQLQRAHIALLLGLLLLALDVVVYMGLVPAAPS